MCITFLLISVLVPVNTPMSFIQKEREGVCACADACVCVCTCVCICVVSEHVLALEPVLQPPLAILCRNFTANCFIYVVPVENNTLQHTATHCNTLPHTATHCHTLQYTCPTCRARACSRACARAASRVGLMGSDSSARVGRCVWVSPDLDPLSGCCQDPVCVCVRERSLRGLYVCVRVRKYACGVG